MKSFEFALEHVLKAEGGYVDHPADKGGPTNYGITIRTLTAARGGAPATAADVKALTKNEAASIYLMRYWRPMGLDGLTSTLIATAVFDQGVNRGPGPAVRALQEALRSMWSPSLEVDGVLGLKALHAANSAPEARLLIRLMIQAQRSYLQIWQADPAQGVFLRGWIARTWRLLDLVP